MKIDSWFCSWKTRFLEEKLCLRSFRCIIDWILIAECDRSYQWWSSWCHRWGPKPKHNPILQQEQSIPIPHHICIKKASLKHLSYEETQTFWWKWENLHGMWRAKLSKYFTHSKLRAPISNGNRACTHVTPQSQETVLQTTNQSKRMLIILLKSPLSMICNFDLKYFKVIPRAVSASLWTTSTYLSVTGASIAMLAQICRRLKLKAPAFDEKGPKEPTLNRSTLDSWRREEKGREILEIDMVIQIALKLTQQCFLNTRSRICNSALSGKKLNNLSSV